jgi:hypothetical protein
MCRQEADIIRYSLAHMMAQGVDGIILEDRESPDGTALEAEATAHSLNPSLPVIVRREQNTGYLQPEVMTRLAHLAGERGADWIIPWDVDELWTAPDGTVAEVLRRSGASVVHVQQQYHYSTVLDDLHEPNPFRRMRWRTNGFVPWSKVAFRYAPDIRIGHGAHSILNEAARGGTGISIRHFPVRSFEQMVSKVLTTAESFNLQYPDDPSWAGQGPSINCLWSLYRQSGIAALREVWKKGDPRTDHTGYVCVANPEGFGLVEQPAHYRGAV